MTEYCYQSNIHSISCRELGVVKREGKIYKEKLEKI